MRMGGRTRLGTQAVTPKSFKSTFLLNLCNMRQINDSSGQSARKLAGFPSMRFIGMRDLKAVVGSQGGRDRTRQ